MDFLLEGFQAIGETPKLFILGGAAQVKKQREENDTNDNTQQ